MSHTVEQSTTSRSLHDIGLAAWFGGSLMGAVGLNGATGEIRNPNEAARVGNAGWARWTPVNFAAIVAHLVGGAGLVGANKGRLALQQGAASANATKTALTASALVVTAWARVKGRQLEKAEATSGAPVEDATTPIAQTPPKAKKAQRSLKRLQWLVPALTGALLINNAKVSEQQRPAAVAKGVWGRLFG